MNYCLMTFDAFKNAIGIEKIDVVKDNITGFHHLIDEFENKYQCQDNIDFTKPMAFYLQKEAAIDEAKLINNLLIFTNRFDMEDGKVMHIKLNISPSSKIGSKEVNEMVELYNRATTENNSWTKIKKLIFENKFSLYKQELNSKLNWGRYKDSSIKKAIFEDKSLDLIHWATTNIKWFYFNYDKIFAEGLSIRMLIEKYGDKKTKEDFKEVLKVYDVKSSILSDWDLIKQDYYDAKAENEEHENWKREIRNDWMDNASDYWNID